MDLLHQLLLVLQFQWMDSMQVLMKNAMMGTALMQEMVELIVVQLNLGGVEQMTLRN